MNAIDYIHDVLLIFYQWVCIGLSHIFDKKGEMLLI